MVEISGYGMKASKLIRQSGEPRGAVTFHHLSVRACSSIQIPVKPMRLLNLKWPFVVGLQLAAVNLGKPKLLENSFYWSLTSVSPPAPFTDY